MAHFVRIRPSGFWTIASTVDPAEWEALDENQFKSINGDDGGSWAPSSPIVVGGSGINVTGPAILGNVTDIDLDGTVNLGASSILVQEAGSVAEFYGNSLFEEAVVTFGNDCFVQVLATAQPVEVSANVLLQGGADVQVGANSEILTQNARNSLVVVPLTIRSRLETAGAGAANSFPLRWGYSPSSGAYPGLPVQLDLTTPEEWVAFALPFIPSTATIVAFTVVASGAVVGRPGLPATMPQARLVRYESNGTRTVVATVTDTTPTVLLYEAPHNINSGVLSEPVNIAGALNWYAIEVKGEYGSAPNANTGLHIVNIRFNYTTTRLNHQWSEVALA